MCPHSGTSVEGTALMSCIPHTDCYLTAFTCSLKAHSHEVQIRLCALTKVGTISFILAIDHLYDTIIVCQSSTAFLHPRQTVEHPAYVKFEPLAAETRAADSRAAMPKPCFMSACIHQEHIHYETLSERRFRPISGNVHSAQTYAFHVMSHCCLWQLTEACYTCMRIWSCCCWLNEICNTRCRW